MIARVLKTAAIAAVCIAAATGAQALSWTFQNVTFGAGGAITGSIDYNAATNTYSALSITVSGVPGQAGSVDGAGIGAGTGQPYSGL